MEVNPVFYVIDGFRWGFVQLAAADLSFGLGLLTALIAALWLLNWRLMAIGYKLKP